MATATEITRVRAMTNASAEEYTDSALNTIIDDNGADLNLSAAQVWEEKAAKAAELVDTTESGSSRKNSALFEKAMEMAGYYRGKSEEAVVDLAARPRTRRIVRL